LGILGATAQLVYIYVLNIYAHKTALETRRQLLRPCFHIKSYRNLIPAELKQSLLGSTVASIFFYHLTPLVVPPGTINFINKIEWAFLWSAKKTTTEAKCKVNWETMCRPKKLRGLGVMNLDKFVTALRLRWLWLQWKDSTKNLGGHGNPCSEEDMNIFYAATSITVVNGARQLFGKLLGFVGENPKILPHSSLQSLEGKLGRSRKL
jgi:hypothetical protein